MEPVSPKLVKHARALLVYAYAGMGKGSTGDQIPEPSYEDYDERTVQVEGEFGNDGVIVILGSNDGENFRALSDAHGVALRFTRPGVKAVSEGVLFVRPEVVGGDDTTQLSVTIVSRRQTSRIGG